MRIRTFVLAATAMSLLACSSTQVHTWQDPSVKGRTFQKLVVLAITKDPSVRRTTENAFIMSVGAKTQVTPSYKFVTEDDLKDKARLVAKIKEGGYDGAVVFRVIAIDEKTQEYKSANYTAAYYGTVYYGGFGDYWGYYGAPVYSSTYSVKTQIVQIETTLYGVSDNKLVFAQQSKLDNPDSTMDVIEAVVRKAADAMKSGGLIQ
jgi:hypothetical protein